MKVVRETPRTMLMNGCSEQKFIDRGGEADNMNTRAKIMQYGDEFGYKTTEQEIQ